MKMENHCRSRHFGKKISTILIKFMIIFKLTILNCLSAAPEFHCLIKFSEKCAHNVCLDRQNWIVLQQHTLEDLGKVIDELVADTTDPVKKENIED
jgi:uncharacterized membrane protein YukC